MLKPSLPPLGWFSLYTENFKNKQVYKRGKKSFAKIFWNRPESVVLVSWMLPAHRESAHHLNAERAAQSPWPLQGRDPTWRTDPAAKAEPQSLPDSAVVLKCGLQQTGPPRTGLLRDFTSALTTSHQSSAQVHTRNSLAVFQNILRHEGEVGKKWGDRGKVQGIIAKITGRDEATAETF